MTTRQRLMSIARGELGVAEVPPGSNWGPRVQQYLASVGLETPNPWCLAFVRFVFDLAMPSANPLPVTGYTPDLLRWARDGKRIIPAKQAQAGDLVLFYFASKGRVAHVGIVGLVKFGFMWTICGNSNSDGGREGWKVVRQFRRVTAAHTFVNALKELDE